MQQYPRPPSGETGTHDNNGDNMNGGSLLYRNDPDQYLKNVREIANREVAKLDVNGDGNFSTHEIEQGIEAMAKNGFVLEQNTLSTTFLLGSASAEEVRGPCVCSVFS